MYKLLLTIGQIGILRQALETASGVYLDTSEYGEADKVFSDAWKQSHDEVEDLRKHVELCLQTNCKGRKFNKIVFPEVAK